MTIQVKAIGQYFLLVLFMILYRVASTFETVDEILYLGDHSNERYYYNIEQDFLMSVFI